MAGDLWAAYRQAALRPRVRTALVGASLVLLATWWGGLWWTGLLVVIMALGMYEFIELHPSIALEVRATAAVGALTLAAAILSLKDPAARQLIAGAAAALVFVVIRHLGAPAAPGTLVSGPWTTALLGAIYLGLPGGVLIRWRLEATAASMAWFLATIWMNDIAAYFVGLAAGSHKMAPAISPGKSWEGGIAGAAAAALTAALGSAAFGLGTGAGALLGTITSITSQAGDLFESAMKRRAGVKDSGALLPGHGGILDRFDGLLVASPVAYLFVSWFGRP